ncbi:hypothetical protein ACHHYP_07322 [Achlya hypogyna]|uniref:Chromosome segregation in meiosis protein 3 domain-containing protein n=1 Tax=Achlya hypogyna TaxID=1202772 RepID=A0A1V9YR16_ACHHY|nr:hypothetical protein ACHHYP_07322 [Achlya hypogyna]
MASTWEDGESILNRPADAPVRKRPAPGSWEARMTEDDGDDAQPPADAPVEAAPAEEAKPKKKRNVFSDQHLLSSRGFRLVYEKFPEHFKEPVVEGMEALALRDLMTCYKEWAYELYPGLRFEDFVERTETIAKKAAVGELLHELRGIEAKRGEPEPDFAEIVHNTPSTHNAPIDDEPNDQEMHDILEYEAMITSMRQQAAKPVAPLNPPEAPSDDEAEFQLAPLKKDMRREVSDDEAEFEVPSLQVTGEQSTDAPDSAFADTTSTENTTGDVGKPTAGEAAQVAEATSQAVDEMASQAMDDEDEVESDEEAGDVMEYEARTSLLRDMVKAPARLARTSKALDEAATLLEEESDSDAEYEFPATFASQASQMPPSQATQLLPTEDVESDATQVLKVEATG